LPPLALLGLAVFSAEFAFVLYSRRAGAEAPEIRRFRG